jgi:hypothetical protein
MFTRVFGECQAFFLDIQSPEDVPRQGEIGCWNRKKTGLGLFATA